MLSIKTFYARHMFEIVTSKGMTDLAKPKSVSSWFQWNWPIHLHKLEAITKISEITPLADFSQQNQHVNNTWHA